MPSTLVFASLLAFCAVPGLAATRTTSDPSPARRLHVPRDVSPRARQVLKTRLAHHATSMQDLMRAVVLLDRPTVQVLADRIATEQTFAPSAISDLDIPFDLSRAGDAFAAAARDVGFAATTGANNDVLADRFAVLTHACVSCHAGYLYLGRKRNPIDMPPEPL